MLAPGYASSPPAAPRAIPAFRRVKAYTVNAPPPSIIPQRCSTCTCDPLSRALRLISDSLAISALLLIDWQKIFASFEFSQECPHRDKAVRVFECRFCLIPPQAGFSGQIYRTFGRITRGDVMLWWYSWRENLSRRPAPLSTLLLLSPTCH